MNIGLLGFGTIGTGVYELINIKGKSLFSDHAPEPSYITKILDKDVRKRVYEGDDHGQLVTDPDAIINDPEIGLVIALCGGMDFEYGMIKRALCAGKHVVTANKAVISEHFEELVGLAREHHVMLRYEASVGGGIPVITSMFDQLRLNHISEIRGILNGTTNYILSRMTAEGADFSDALKSAQAIGFAEADPTADVDGFDVSRKLAVLSSIAYGGIVRDEDIRKRTMRDVRAVDIEYCGDNGYVVKYLGHSKLEGHRVYTTVEPVLVPEQSMLSNVNSEFNIVSIKGDVIGELQFYGKGAGKDATANAVVSDVLVVLNNLKHSVYPMPECFDNALEQAGIDAFSGRYYLRVNVTSNEMLRDILRIIEPVGNELSVVLSYQHLFITTGVVPATVFDEVASALRACQPEMFYARIYNGV